MKHHCSCGMGLVALYVLYAFAFANKPLRAVTTVVFVAWSRATFCVQQLRTHGMNWQQRFE